MKKLWSILICAALLCALCACGGQQAQTTEDGPAQTAGDSRPQTVSTPNSQEAAPQEAAQPDGGQAAPAPGDVAPDNTEPESPESAGEPAESPAPAQTEKPKERPESKPEQDSRPEEKPEPQSETPEPKPKPAPEPEPEPEPEPKQDIDRKAVAEGLVGRPVSELYAAIGRPISSDYAPSCLVVDGEDGELVYAGFTVYTEKGPDYETVYAVF